MTLLLAASCGLIVANLYYAQPLLAPISEATGISLRLAGWVVTITQIGYGLGLLLVVPLGDLLENRRLIVRCMLLAAVGLALAGSVTQAWLFMLAMGGVGVASVAAQILVPYGAGMADDASRGRVVGNIMSGLLLGIMLARPVASLVADRFGWHAIFLASAVVLAGVALSLQRLLPPRQPVASQSYRALLASMGQLVRSLPVLRHRTLYHALLFGAFSVFWTTVPLLLASPRFGLSQTGIAVFALVGVAGAVSAPIAGRLADRGFSQPLTAAAMLLVASAFVLTWLAPGASTLALLMFAAAGVVLDFGVSAHLVLSQRAVYALAPESRSRLNSLFIGGFFAGGAVGSASGVFAYVHGGWPAVAAWGAVLPLMALAAFAIWR